MELNYWQNKRISLQDKQFWFKVVTTWHQLIVVLIFPPHTHLKNGFTLFKKSFLKTFSFYKDSCDAISNWREEARDELLSEGVAVLSTDASLSVCDLISDDFVKEVK